MEDREGPFASFVAAKKTWIEARDAKLHALASLLGATLEPRTDAIRAQIWQSPDLMEEISARTGLRNEDFTAKILASPDSLEKIVEAGEPEKVDRTLEELDSKQRRFRNAKAERREQFRRAYEQN